MPSTGRSNKAKFLFPKIIRQCSEVGALLRGETVPMSAERSQRPGGVTVLAIINFLGFAISLLTLLWEIYSYFTSEVAGEGTSYSSMSAYFVIQGCNVALCLLLVITGIGLIGCRKLIGRHFTTALFLVSLAKAIAVVNLAPEEFNLFTVALVVWPLVAAVLVNTVFTDDLTQ